MDSSSLGVVQSTDGEVEREKVKGEVEKALDLMFSTVTSKLQKLCNLIVAEVDGMEILGILAVLQQYVTDHLISKQQILQTQQQQQVLPEKQQSQSQLQQQQHTGILTTSTSTTHNQNIKTEINKPDHSSLYLITMLHELRTSLLSKLKAYMGDQVAWIAAQKSDPKKAGVTVPVAKFPSFVRQVLEMTGGQVCLSDILLLCITPYCSFYIIVFFVMVLCLYVYLFAFFDSLQYLNGIFNFFSMFFCEYDDYKDFNGTLLS